MSQKMFTTPSSYISDFLTLNEKTQSIYRLVSDLEESLDLLKDAQKQINEFGFDEDTFEYNESSDSVVNSLSFLKDNITQLETMLLKAEEIKNNLK